MLVPLTQGKHAVIDAADAELVAGHAWCAALASQSHTLFYATAKVGGRGTKLHKFLWAAWGLPPVSLDHEDGDGLNCRRGNLRPATQSQNLANARTPSSNTSGYKGVSWNSRIGRWVAQIGWAGKKRNLGAFSDPETAHAAYLRAAQDLHGEFARAA